MIHRCFLALALIPAGWCTVAPVRAAGSKVEVLDDEDLSRQRAGFAWNGLNIRFGAEMSSYLDGELVMRTTVNWTDSGSDVRRAHFVSSASLPDLENVLATSGPRSGIADGDTIVVNAGQTAFEQRADGAVQSIIVNKANNVDLRQQLDVTLDIAGFAPLHAASVSARIGSALSGLGQTRILRGRTN